MGVALQGLGVFLSLVTCSLSLEMSGIETGTFCMQSECSVPEHWSLSINEYSRRSLSASIPFQDAQQIRKPSDTESTGFGGRLKSLELTSSQFPSPLQALLCPSSSHIGNDCCFQFFSKTHQFTIFLKNWKWGLYSLKRHSEAWRSTSETESELVKN